MTVVVVFPRTVCIIVHIVQTGIDGAYQTGTTQVGSLRREFHIHIHHAARIEHVRDLRVAETSLADSLHNHITAGFFHSLTGTGGFQSVFGLLEAVVFNPAVVIKDETFTAIDDIQSVQAQGSHPSGCGVKGCIHKSVADGQALTFFLHGQLRYAGIDAQFRQSGTAGQFKLLLGYFMTGSGPYRCLALAHGQVDHHFFTVLRCFLQIYS